MRATRRIIVGVIGGDQNMQPGVELGREVTRRGWILLTGGQLRQRDDVARSGEVKEAVMLGAAAAEREGLTARLIGILPDRQQAGRPNWHRPLPHHLFLSTGLAHNIRNVINGRTPDVLVAFGGSRGTLAEMAFAMAAGRQVLVHRGFARLLKNFDAHFGPKAEPKHRMDYLAAPRRIYPEAAQSVDELLSLLHQMFAAGAPAEADAVDLAERIAATTQAGDASQFPGLPHEADSIERFERILWEISQ